MSRFLFVLWEGGGTSPPELAVAGRLAGRGHAVHVLGDPTLLDDARAAGATFTPFREAPHRTTRTAESEIIQDWAATTPLGAFARARDRHAFAPAGLFAKEVVAAQRDFGADALAVDAMLFGGLVGAEATGRPWAALIPMTSLLPAPGRPPPALGLRPARGALGALRDRALHALGDALLWRSCLPLLNRARGEVGLPPLAHPLDQIRRADRVLVQTSPAFDFGAPAREGNVWYTGPELADPSWASPLAPGLEDDGTGRRLVVVALSSTYQGQERVLARVVEAMGPLEARAVVTLGPALSGHVLESPDNVRVVPSASHAALFRRARLVVTHGGHGTVLRAIAAGVPVLVLPMGRDQDDNAVRAVSMGAGVRLSARASARAIRRAIASALSDPGLLAGAARAAKVLEGERAGDPAVEAMASLTA